MDEMLARFTESLAELGIATEAGRAVTTPHRTRQAVIHVSRGTSTRDYFLLFGPNVKFADVAKAGAGDLPRMVFTDFVAPKTADALRRAETQYLDTAGNAWIEFGDVLIDVRGRRPRREATVARPRAATGNLFSSSRAQVVFALLAWPHLWGAPQRDLAHAAGVSVGQANNTLHLLAEAGYDHRHPPRQADLLDLWAAAFPTGLAKRLTLATYRGDVEQVHQVNANDPIFLSGEHAMSDALRPATLTLYVEQLDPRLAIKNRWRTDGTPNVVLRRKFWHAPPNRSAEHNRPLAGLRNAPWPLVYADLAASADPRVRNAAEEWKDRFAGPEEHS